MEVNGNPYSMLWRLIEERMTVMVRGGEIRVVQALTEVARHAVRVGRHGRVCRRPLRGDHRRARVAAGIENDSPDRLFVRLTPVPFPMAVAVG